MGKTNNKKVAPNILLVDDETSVLYTLEAILKPEG